MHETVKKVLDGFQELILANLKGATQEQYFPSGDPDGSDEKIREGIERVAALRKMRDEFEDLVTGVVRHQH